MGKVHCKILFTLILVTTQPLPCTGQEVDNTDMPNVDEYVYVAKASANGKDGEMFISQHPDDLDLLMLVVMFVGVYLERNVHTDLGNKYPALSLTESLEKLTVKDRNRGKGRRNKILGHERCNDN